MNILLICPTQDGTIETVESVFAHARRLIAAREEPTDLVVLPEGYLSLAPEQEREGAYGIMREYSLALNCPLLMGMSTIDGPEKAYYINPFAEEGETHYHTIVKHSSANQILFDYEQQSYKTFDAPSTTMYEPIRLNGRDIQPIICHDMFFPLITSRLYAEGMDVMINLTGGGVVRSKWHQMLSGLSEAYHAPVLCTMNRYDSSKTSETIAYDRLDRIVPSEEQIIDGHQFSWIAPEHYTQYDIEPPARWSDKRYDALTVGQNGDISLGERAGTLSTTLPIVSQKRTEGGYDEWIVEKEGARIHVSLHPYESLYDPLLAWSAARERDVEANDHFVFLFDERISDEDFFPANDETWALLRLRAIENRIALVAFNESGTFGAKTNRYKNVQLFQGETIGFDLQHMHGPFSTFQKNSKSKMGIASQWIERYAALQEADDFPLMYST